MDVYEEYSIPIRDKEVVLYCEYRARLLTYLKLGGRSIGCLINWKVPRMIWQKR
jgi:hypothetical protein